MTPIRAQVDPENEAIKRGIKLSAENKVTTGLTTIGDEKQFNVFMRLDSDAVKYIYLRTEICVRLTASDTARNATGTSGAVEAMDKLRTMKNNF